VSRYWRWATITDTKSCAKTQLTLVTSRGQFIAENGGWVPVRNG
jgi:hypothetical protein